MQGGNLPGVGMRSEKKVDFEYQFQRLQSFKERRVSRDLALETHFLHCFENVKLFGNPPHTSIVHNYLRFKKRTKKLEISKAERICFLFLPDRDNKNKEIKENVSKCICHAKTRHGTKKFGKSTAYLERLIRPRTRAFETLT